MLLKIGKINVKDCFLLIFKYGYNSDFEKPKPQDRFLQSSLLKLCENRQPIRQMIPRNTNRGVWRRDEEQKNQRGSVKRLLLLLTTEAQFHWTHLGDDVEITNNDPSQGTKKLGQLFTPFTLVGDCSPWCKLCGNSSPLCTQAEYVLTVEESCQRVAGSLPAELATRKPGGEKV